MDTLTIFKNHSKKIFCVDKDCCLFSISQCQSITVSRGMIYCETTLAESDGFKEVSCAEFNNELQEV